MHARSRRIGLLALATAMATLLVIGLFAYNEWKAYRDVFATTANAHRVLTLNESLLRHMDDSETGQRGFILNGNPEYLEPYNNALEKIPGEVAELKSLVAGHPRQRERVNRLEPLIAAKLERIRQTIDVRRAEGLAAAMAFPNAGEGKRIMDRIRLISQEIEGDENARWSTAWEELRSTAQRVRIVTLIGALLLATLVIFGGISLKRSAAEMELLIGELTVARQNAEKAGDLLRVTLYSIGDGVITTDNNGMVQMINSTAEKMTGRTEQEARGRSIEEVFPIVNEATRETVESPVRRVLREGQVVGLANHTVLISKSGVDIPIDDSGAPITLKDGSTSGVVLVFRDVSDRKQAERVEQRLAAIVENSEDPIIGKTLDGIVISWNQAAERLFGYSAEEMIGNPVARMIPPERPNEMTEILERIRQDLPVEHYETERIAKDGRRVAVSLTVSPIRDRRGHIIGASKIARDITRQRRMEAALRETQKLEAVGRLAGGVAHDFNNLLTVILGYATVLENQLDAQDKLRRTAVEIRRAGEQASALIGQLLAFGRKQMTQPRVLDVNELVLGMRDVLQRVIGEDIELDVTPCESPSQVRADPGQLTQAMMTLAMNARDAMPTGGKLIIEIKQVQREQKDLGRPAGPYVLLTVTDTGTGMDAETQRHLFEPFFTTKDTGKGAGLGLSSTYGIVQQNGGWIEVYSEVGHGTAFRIYLPEVSAATAEAPRVPESPHVRTGTILLVEDQAAIRMLAEDVLSEAGYRVLAAGNGTAALRLATEHKGEIDLLVTDVVMPEINGPDLANKLLLTRPDLLVLFISGYTDHALLRRGVIEEGTALLQKPFLPETLVAKVAEVLGVRC